LNKSDIQRESELKSLVNTSWVYQGKIIQLKLETYELEHKKKVAEIIEHPGAVVIIPIDPQGNILLVKQWRRAVGEITMELPAGTLEDNEDPAECAKRELQEETGFGTQKLTPFGGFFSAPGFCDEYLHLFLAENLYLAPQPQDPDEMTDLVVLTPEEAKAKIMNNEIHDAKTVAGILRYLCAKS